MRAPARTVALVLVVVAGLAALLWKTGALAFLDSSRPGPSDETAAGADASADAGHLRGSDRPATAREPKDIDGDPIGVLVLHLGTSTLQGVVTGGKTPLYGARVLPVLAAPEDGHAVRTGKDGRFEIRGLPASADLDVRASADGHLSRSVRAPTLAENATVDVGEIALRPRPAAGDGLEVKVVDGAGRAVSGARVTISTLPYGSFLNLGTRGGMPEVRSSEGKTGDDGVAKFVPLAAEKYDVCVRAEGFALQAAENVVVAAGRVEKVTVRLSPGLSMSGKVVDAEGAGVAGGRVVCLRTPNFKIFESATTEADGSFTLTGLDAGQYWVMAFQQEKGEGQNQGAKAGDRDVRIQLRGTGRVVGKVVGADGKPVPSFALRPFRSGEPFNYVYSRLLDFKDPEGKFALALAPGAYQVDAKAEGGTFKPGTNVTVKGGEDTPPVTITLGGSGVVLGAVTDPDGNHVPDVEVFVGKGGFPPSPVPELYARTNGDGAFRITGFPLEPVKLVVRHKAWATKIVDATPAAEEVAKAMTIRLEAGSRVLGHVTTTGKAPVAGERVTLSRGMDFLDARTTYTDAGGAYVFRGVAEGRAQLTLGAFENMSPGQQRTIDATATGETVVDFVTEGGGAATGAVAGRVTMNKQPLADATVSAYDERGVSATVSAKTDADGRYRIDGLQPGRANVWVETGDGLAKSRRVRIESPGAVAELDLEFGTGTLRGTVIAEGPGLPVSAAWITVLVSDENGSGWENVRGQVSTDAQGKFTARGLEAGSYRVRAWATGLAERHTDATPLAEGETKDVGTIRLVAGGSISGRVTDDAGKPVADAGVSMVDSAGKPLFLFSMFSTGTDGRYEVRGLELGTYVMRFEAKGYAPAERSVTVGATGVTVDAVVARGGALAVNVSDDRGRPVEGARIELSDSAGRKLERTLTIVNLFDADVSRTNAQGVATIPDLAPGTYTVRVTKDGLVPAGDPPVVAVPPGGNASTTVPMRAGT
jgi:protocatechuate 3,4-dioxygenase beta subunit